MKRTIRLLILLVGLTAPFHLLAQYTGGAEALIDQCDEDAAGYDPSVCEEATCDPASVNYDVDQCDEQVCDDSSVNFDASECETETCDSDNVNYDEDECDEQVCDDSSINFDASECEIESCDPDNVNYSKSDCVNQKCDPTSVNYDPVQCGDCSAIPNASVMDGAPPSTPLTACQYGQTWPESVSINIGACNDGANWNAVITQVIGNYSVQTRLLPGQIEVTGPNTAAPGGTTLANFCFQYTDLSTYGNVCTDQYYMIEAVIAHENVHVTHLLPALNQVMQQIQQEVQALNVPSNGLSETEAINQIQSLPGFTQAQSDALSAWQIAFGELSAGDHSGPTDAAEAAVVNPMLASMCAAAKANNWFLECPFCQ